MEGAADVGANVVRLFREVMFSNVVKLLDAKRLGARVAFSESTMFRILLFLLNTTVASWPLHKKSRAKIFTLIVAYVLWCGID